MSPLKARAQKFFFLSREKQTTGELSVSWILELDTLCVCVFAQKRLYNELKDKKNINTQNQICSLKAESFLAMQTLQMQRTSGYSFRGEIKCVFIYDYLNMVI